MSRERFDHAIVQELEQELRQALAIEPSPDFARQVRARIGRQPRVFRWSPVLSAAAVCALAIGVGWRVTWGPAEIPWPPSVRVGTDVQLKLEPPEVRFKAATTTARLTPHTRRVSASEPEVIVPPEGARALFRLLELARSGVVDEESLRPVVAAASPMRLAVAPIVVPAITVPEIDIQSGTARGGADHK